MVKLAKIVVHEVDEPGAVANLPDADFLCGEHVTEVDSAFTDADAATACRVDESVVIRVPRRRWWLVAPS